MIHSTQQPVFLMKISSYHSSAQSTTVAPISSESKQSLRSFPTYPFPPQPRPPLSFGSYPLALFPLDNLKFSSFLELYPGTLPPPGFRAFSSLFLTLPPPTSTWLTFPPLTVCLNTVFSERYQIIWFKYAIPEAPLSWSSFFYHAIDLVYLVCLWLVSFHKT